MTANGDRIACDFAVAGIGIDPDVPTVAGSSIAQANGVLVDELCRTSAPDVYAAGDVANHLHPVFGRVRVEHVGHVAKWDEFVVRGSLEEGRLVGFYLLKGRVQAAVGLDRGGDPELDRDSEMAACAHLVAVQARPARGLLADERVDLWSLGNDV